MKIKKEMTLIFSDSVEKQIMALIAEEAEKRNYKVLLTDDKFAKCEIGFYCQHTNFPENSKFSIIMLHDITQQFDNWPDIWFREPWNKYDIGFLPGKNWVNNWNLCSQYFYSRPRKGMYLVGWPKADIVAKVNSEEEKKCLMLEYGLDVRKKTVLYAPAWENDGKQDEFVKAAKKLNVNIIIKQAPWNPSEYPEQVREIEKMNAIHRNMQGVTIIDPKVNILKAISMCDILVSEESSTMCECVMMGKPAISVSDWLIPDVTPSRYPSTNYDFVVKTKKEDLTKCMQDILDNYERYETEAKRYSSDNFVNIGKCVPIMMDIIDSFVESQESPHKPLVPQDDIQLDGIIYKQFKKTQRRRYIYAKYCCRYKVAMFGYLVFKKMKSFVMK